MAEYRPDPRILALGPDFYDAVEPASFPQCIARFTNGRWADRIGLSETDWDAHFCRFEAGEALERGDEPSPTRSSVLTRLSHGHIRIGTFQRVAFFGQVENLSKLIRYCLESLFNEPVSDDDAENALRLFDLVSDATAA